MFIKRKNGSAIIFSGDYVAGQPVKLTIENGDRVLLRLDNEAVLIKDIRRLGDARFRGEIDAFEPSLAVEFQSLKVGDEVEFGEEHIISCSPKRRAE